jgi:hypothetical protein
MIQGRRRTTITAESAELAEKCQKRLCVVEQPDSWAGFASGGRRRE